LAQTLMQILHLKPGTVRSDAVLVLEREGILIPTSDGFVTAQTFRRVISDHFVQRAATGRGNDDDGNSPTPTRPGNGYGDKNHEHTGPPGKTGK
ncbi:MAG TPA: hypothetical protein VJ063_01370, partial [Verrucomicrobiae bacterium]|nr:hypothetical protein [Verrucomicrobiae bacterium]